jgi:hypothetical protein
MVYSDIIKAGLILPAKKKYTLKDVYSVLNNSLFNPFNGKTLTLNQAAFIVICSAVYHNTIWADSITKLRIKLYKTLAI